MIKPTNTGPWLIDSPLLNSYPALDKNLSTDVVIIGGGITGLMHAYYLNKCGKRVILLEKNILLSGETSVTTAFITNVVDSYLTDLVKEFGKSKAKLIWESNIEAIDEIEKIVKEFNIDCEFERISAYIFAQDNKGKEILENVVNVARDLDFDTHFHEDNFLPFSNMGIMEVKNQAKFHPLKFLTALAKELTKQDVQIFENTEVLSIENHTEHENKLIIKTNSGEIDAKYSITCTYTPFNAPLIQSKLLSTQSYVLELEIEKGKIPYGIYWDTNNPYNYFRVDNKEKANIAHETTPPHEVSGVNEEYEVFDRLILGGRDHTTGKGPSGLEFDVLESYFKNLNLNIKYKIINQWSGEIIESIDGIPYIGHYPFSDNRLLATAFAGNGMTFSNVSAILNTDIIIRRENKYHEIYSPKRFHGLGEFIKKGVNYFAEIFKSKNPLESNKDTNSSSISNISSISNLNKDSGIVIKEDNKKVAVYKDNTGNITKLSAVCTHMGCTINWNKSAKTWDCPCHGSRFNMSGDVLNGPASKLLEKV